jgi:hypothetical protein
MAAGKSAGRAVRIWLKAVRPPADAAMATTSNAALGKWVSSFFTECFSLTKNRGTYLFGNFGF